MNKSVHEASIYTETVKRKSQDQVSTIACGALSHACKNACKFCNKSLINFKSETGHSNPEFGRAML